MKKIYVFLLAILLFSCSTDKDDIGKTSQELNKINLDLDKIYSLIKDKGYNKSLDTFALYDNEYLAKGNSTTSSIEVANVTVDETNLNSLASFYSETDAIISITMVTNSNDEVKGTLLHILKDDGSIEINTYERDQINDTYTKIEFPAKRTNGVKLNNILFVITNLFPGHNIETIGINRINQIPSDTYDDVALLEFHAKYPSNDLPYEYTIVYEAACGITHQCWSNSGPVCHPFGGGCRQEVCSHYTIPSYFYFYDLPDEYLEYDENLNNENLYAYKEELLETRKGKFYVDGYYAVSSHFLESVDVNLLVELSLASFELHDFTNAFLNNDNNYILTESTYNKIVNIAEQSSTNSDSQVYKNVMSYLINETATFKNKNMSEIKSILNNN